MAEPRDIQNSGENAAAPAPNRRERRSGKSAASVHHGGKPALLHQSAPVAPRRQYSTRRS
ncbi:MAG: hypothetical protein JO287_08550 [Pseudonocardiales bacterium]|nr:hypothetical protein [Pseudonocardiales bacterium]